LASGGTLGQSDQRRGASGTGTVPTARVHHKEPVHTLRTVLAVLSRNGRFLQAHRLRLLATRITLTVATVGYSMLAAVGCAARWCYGWRRLMIVWTASRTGPVATTGTVSACWCLLPWVGTPCLSSVGPYWDRPVHSRLVHMRSCTCVDEDRGPRGRTGCSMHLPPLTLSWSRLPGTRTQRCNHVGNDDGPIFPLDHELSDLRMPIGELPQSHIIVLQVAPAEAAPDSNGKRYRRNGRFVAGHTLQAPSKVAEAMRRRIVGRGR
jgi:hypothetical protein